MSFHKGLIKYTGWLLGALSNLGMHACACLTAASCMVVPCKAHMLVGPCAQCPWGLHEHSLSAVAHPAPRCLAVEIVLPTLGGLHSLLITFSEVMLVG